MVLLTSEANFQPIQTLLSPIRSDMPICCCSQVALPSQVYPEKLTPSPDVPKKT